jgi:membrane-anchored protein YejM (alkaline phosphatase superfamily)
VPFVVHWPNGTKKINAKLTSHLDMVPSVMRYIGVTNPPSDYSNGYPLQDANYTRDFAYIGNWNDNAILTNKYVHTFSNLPNRMFDNKTYDTKTYKLVDPGADKQKQQILLKVLKQNSRFIN